MPLTHNNWKNYTFKMQTQDESEAQILRGHTVVAVDLWVALQIKVQITTYIKYILEISATWIPKSLGSKSGTSDKVRSSKNLGHLSASTNFNRNL